MHVSLCSYCTIRIPVSEPLTGIYEGGYMYIFEMCCYRTLDIVLYIVLLIKKYVYNKTTHAFYILLYQECKRLGSHSAF